MLTVGIDPGLSGALAVLDADGAIALLADLPVIRDRSLAWIDGGAMQTMLLDAIQGRPCRAVVERVSAMPRQGIASAFTFGVGLGSILATLQTLRLPIELTLAKHDGRAEALLIAWWAMRRLTPKEAA